MDTPLLAAGFLIVDRAAYRSQKFLKKENLLEGAAV